MSANRTAAPLQVVIGCASEDAPAMRALAQRLRIDGVAPCLIPDEIGGQPDELRVLRDALRNADVVIVVLSRRAVDAGGKAGAAISRLLDALKITPGTERMLIALRLSTTEIPAALHAATPIDLFGYSGYERLLATLREHKAAQRQAAPPEPEPAPEAPLSPALTLRGRFVLPALQRQGQLRRLGRGVARAIWLLEDRRALVVAGGGASLLDTDTGRSLWSIDCPTRCAALSPGRQLLALAADTTISIWDLKDGRLRNQLSGHSDLVAALAFSPDERSLVSAGYDNSLRLWRSSDDGNRSPLLANLPAHNDHVISVAFSPDGSLMASGSDDRTVRIWRTLDRVLVQTLTGHGGPVEALAFSPDGTLLAAGSRGRNVKLWQVRGWRILRSLDAHDGAVEALAFNTDGSLLASGASDHALRIWRVADGSLIRVLKNHNGPVAAVGFSPDGRSLASLGEDDRLLVWETDSGEMILSQRPLGGKISALAFSADATLLASGTSDGVVTVYDPEAEAPPQTYALEHRGTISSLAFESARRLVTTSSDRTVRACQIDSGQSTILLQTHGAIQLGIVAPGGQLLASSDGDNTIQIWRLSGEQQTPGGTFWRVLRSLGSRPRQICFAPQGIAIAVAGEDGAVRIWRIANLDADQGDPLITLSNTQSRLRCMAFSPDASLLAAGCEKGEVLVWRTTNAAPLLSLPGAGRAIVGLAFAPDGKSVAAGDSAGGIQIWRLPTDVVPAGANPRRRRELTPHSVISGHAGAVEQLVYSPTGGMLASGSADGTVRLWRV